MSKIPRMVIRSAIIVSAALAIIAISAAQDPQPFLSTQAPKSVTVTTSTGTSPTVKFPFGTDATWKIEQGYNHGTHPPSNYQRYSLDLVRDDGATSGQTAYAPAAGHVAWGGTSSDPKGCISIKMPPDYQHRVMLCHIIFDHNFSSNPNHEATGEYVSQGQQLGTVAPAGQKGNNGIAHIHITLYHLPTGENDAASNRTGIPFDDANGWPLDGVNFAKDDSISNQYQDVYGLCSSQNTNPTIKVERLMTMDATDDLKYTFRRGDSIHYWTNVTNSSSTNVSSSYDWAALGPSSTTIFVWSGILDDAPGNHWWYAPWPIVPASATDGYYTFRVEADHDGVKSCRANVFRVQGDVPPVDVYMLVDLSSSFADDLPRFKSQAPNVISSLTASNPNTHFGLGRFEDYPIPPFGGANWEDKAYERLVDLTSDTDLVLDTIAGLSTRWGGDSLESQLPALYQAATGAGQDLSGVGYPGASIPAGQQASFRYGATKLFLLWTDAPFHRPGDPGDIPYPGPSFDDTADAILALDPPKVIGISSGTDAISDLSALAAATGAFAPADGVDCDGNGTIDIAPGRPLVCQISATGDGIGEAITALVEGGQKPAILLAYLPAIFKHTPP